jgi:hypothetical protein
MVNFTVFALLILLLLPQTINPAINKKDSNIALMAGLLSDEIN